MRTISEETLQLFERAALFIHNHIFLGHKDQVKENSYDAQLMETKTDIDYENKLRVR